MRVRWEIGRRNQFIKVCCYKRHKMNCLCSLSKTWINQKSIYLESVQNRCRHHQPNTNAYCINPKSMLLATDFLLVGFFDLKTFILRSIPLTCNSARSRRRSCRIHPPKDNPSLRERGGASQTMVGEGQTKILSPTPHPFGGYLFPKEKVSSAYWNSGFCNSGQALRAEWHEGEVRDWKKKPVH